MGKMKPTNGFPSLKEAIFHEAVEGKLTAIEIGEKLGVATDKVYYYTSQSGIKLPTHRVSKKALVKAMLAETDDPKVIAVRVDAPFKYVARLVRDLKTEALHAQGLAAPQKDTGLIYAAPRPCGPFEELAWKLREREQKRREIMLETRA